MRKIILATLVASIFIGCASKPKPQPTKTLYNNDKGMYQKFLMKKSEEELDKELDKEEK